MKKILIIMLSIMAMGCEKELDIAPQSSFTTENFYRNQNDIEQVVTSAYAFLQSEGQYGENFHFFMEVRADNSVETGLTTRGGSFGEFEVFNINPSNSVLNETWTDCYKGIQSCNIVINRIDAIPGMSQNLKDVRKGEALFIRALTYFNLVRIWGDVPLVLKETVNPFDYFDIGKTAAATIYAQIETDLQTAANFLPIAQSQVGRATKGAAQALLGKVYLTQNKYGPCITTLRALNGYGYEIVGSYAQVFGPQFENSKESIFEIQFTGGIGGEGTALTNLFTPLGANSIVNNIGTPSGHNSPTKELRDAYAANDLRKAVTIGEVNGKLYPKKYITEPKGPNDSDVNVVVLRYADVLLMLAEALNEQGYSADANGEAFKLINQIRNRAGLSNYTPAMLPNQSSFRDAVAKERRFELAFENHRWFDLVRTGKFVSVMNSSSQEAGPFTVSQNNAVYPIPLAQIDINPTKIKQNEGY
ncbi:RagB/SusD family nutrient uptake outer membrane protein [Pedobacter endophyticus]|uniref:RagB/SusD family nutrient uptake outer membrane protein n=1 Tax=Pedobacter endophyticus TaxID=2789740 RepID=A0A7U3SQ42_9SPHI|nr:RagB/SusD family nutrient uptake outer membrane protein [Pedobacter endophyticus]QPH38554.1 RagB/SusD family nutrient uptake outer membrane protein [Pedobacter endophyticus]